MSQTLTHTDGAPDSTSAGRRSGRKPSPRKRRRSGSNRQASTGWIFVAPFMAIFALFTVIPILMALAVSFTDFQLRDIRNPFQVNLVGLDTFISLFSNATFTRSLLNTLLYVMIAVPGTMIIGFSLALALDRGLRRLRTVFRGAFFIPVTANAVAAAVIWQYAFTSRGPINEALSWVSVDGPSWLNNPTTAFFSVVLLAIWRNIGICMVLFLAGLQAIPEDVREAASLDGAGKWRTTVSIVIPLLRPTTMLVCVLMTIMFLNTFEEPYLVTGGGPLGSTRSIAQWIYEQVGFGGIAQAMAASIFLLLLVIIVCLIQMRVLRPKH